MPEKTEPKIERTIVYKLKQTRLHAGESKIRWWYAEIEEGTPYKKLFDPIYWDVHGYKFQIGDFIMCEPDEGDYSATLRVRSIGVGGIRIVEHAKVEYEKRDMPVSLSSQYEVKFKGSHNKYCVIRLVDKHTESSGHPTESDANRWLADNLKALSKSLPKASEAA